MLDYLMHNCHTGAARAFMKECGVTPADGEADRDRDAVIFVPGHKPHKTSEEELRTLEERLAMGELRKGALPTSSPLSARAQLFISPVRHPEPHTDRPDRRGDGAPP